MRPHTVDIFGVHASTVIKYSIHLDKFDHDLTSHRDVIGLMGVVSGIIPKMDFISGC